MRRGFSWGVGLTLGSLATAIIAVSVGTITSFTSGTTISSSAFNTNFTNLQTALTAIPNWTKATNGTDAYYTAGNVGIGTTSP